MSETQIVPTAPATSATPFTVEEKAELQATVRDALNGVRDRVKMRQACERMDRTREEIYRRIGVVDFASPTVRALREGDGE